MVQKIKQFIGILLIVFCFTSLVLAILSIWEVIDSTMAKEVLINTSYSFGAIFIVSMLVYLIVQLLSDKK